MKVKSQFQMLNSSGQSPTKADPLLICKPLRNDSFASGMLIIRPLEKKPSQCVCKDTMVCQRLFHLGTFTFNARSPGCLQLLDILENSWNLIGPPGNFCVRCRRSTALASSCKDTKFIAIRCVFFKFQMHQNPFSVGAPPQTPVGELLTLPQIPIRLGRAKIPILWVFQLSEGGRSKANMSWIFLKIPPVTSWKFA